MNKQDIKALEKFFEDVRETRKNLKSASTEQEIKEAEIKALELFRSEDFGNLLTLSPIYMTQAK